MELEYKTLQWICNQAMWDRFEVKENHPDVIYFLGGLRMALDKRADPEQVVGMLKNAARKHPDIVADE